MNSLLIALNSFKDCLDAVQAGNILKENSDLQSLKISTMPLSDGGTGFYKVCKDRFSLEELSYSIYNSFDNSVKTYNCGYDSAGKSIYIESAHFTGEESFPVKNPLKYTSVNLGRYLRKIIEDKYLKVEKVIIGIGGTRTVDLGMGLFEEFGFKLFDRHKKSLQICPENFIFADEILLPDIPFNFDVITVSDVDNPLFGDNGGIRVYGPQKGLKSKEIERVESGIENLFGLFEKNGIKRAKLSGAGGGLAAGLDLLANSKNISSKEFILNDLKINHKEILPDFIITGEGSFDSQSFDNKGTWVVINEYKKKVKKIFLVCGKIETDVLEKLPETVEPVDLSKRFSSIEESIEKFEIGLQYACRDIKKIINSIF